jgi:prepilin-type N-terminal cleavage/methylation domain-containing protein
MLKKLFRKHKSGFSLIEVMLSAVILVIGVLGAMNIFIPMFRSIENDRQRVEMTNVTLDRIEEWRAYTYSQLQPDMAFTYFTRVVNRDTGSITFGQHTIVIDSVSKINLTPDAQTVASGYDFTFNLPSAPNMSGGVDNANDVWYDGPDNTVGNNTPGLISLTLGCPHGVSGILRIQVRDYNSQLREEKVYINGIVVAAFSDGDADPGNNFSAMRTVQYTLTQTDTQSGQILIEIRQTTDSNLPTFGGANPNAVLSSVDFSVLEGFTEHDSNYPYLVESVITSTYDDIRLVPGWQITVTTSRPDSERAQPVSLTTTISK